MTVRELISALKNYDEDLPIVIANCEFGFDDLAQLQLLETVQADHGEAKFVLSNGEAPEQKVRVLCLGPKEPSVMEK
jgi:hypothetical protein